MLIIRMANFCLFNIIFLVYGTPVLDAAINKNHVSLNDYYSARNI